MAIVQFPKAVSRRFLQRTAEKPYDGSPKDNIKWAKLAVQFVVSAVVAANKVFDEVETMGVAAICVATARGVYAISELVNKPPTMRAEITRLAEVALNQVAVIVGSNQPWHSNTLTITVYRR